MRRPYISNKGICGEIQLFNIHCVFNFKENNYFNSVQGVWKMLLLYPGCRSGYTIYTYVKVLRSINQSRKEIFLKIKFRSSAVAMSEVATEVQGVYPLEENSLMGQFWPGKAPRPKTLKCLLLCCAFTCLLLGYTLGSGMMLKGMGRSPLSIMQCVLSHGDALFFWAFLSVAVMKMISS